MDEKLDRQKGLTSAVQVMAHRTAWRLASENTLAGIQVCIDRGYDWVEMDVRQSADGRHVLMHDQIPDRSAEIEIPTLTDALSLAKGRIRVYLDARDIEPAGLVRDIREQNILENVILCIAPHLRQAIRDAGGNDIPLISTYRSGHDLDLYAPAILEIPIAQISPSLVAKAKEQGAGVGCLAMGQQDNPEGWRKAIQACVDWIMTDFPDGLREMLRS